MGLLTTGQPLDWTETKKNAELVKRRGVEQFIKLYKAYKNRDRLDSFKYGDEVEYSLVRFDHLDKKVYCLLKAQEILSELVSSNNKQPHVETLWSPEFANFMIEGLPGRPYEHNINCILQIERNMILRRQQVQQLLGLNESCMTFSTFPLLGCPNFTWPISPTTPGRGITTSMFFPDNAVFQGHPRYAASIINNRQRRQSRCGSHIPIYVDKNTPQPFVDSFGQYAMVCEDTDSVDELVSVSRFSKSDHIYLEGIGASCSCLQVTFQARNLDEARRLYDQLTPITPLMLALSASSPIWRGYLSEIDCRWRVISESLDDRTQEERGEKPLQNDRYRIFKSRYDSVDCYLSQSAADLNDIEIVTDDYSYKTLIQNGVDEMMAKHISHLFIRDPLVLYKENLNQPTEDDCVRSNDDDQTDLWENIQSTNWQSMRFKPPPNIASNSNIGWRVEFRTTELQITDFENAAFVAFLVLLSRTILSFNLNLLLPISKVDENMKRAQKRDACVNERFYFRLNPFDQSNDQPSSNMYAEMSMNEIINGSGDRFVGLVPLIKQYLAQLDHVDVETNCKMMHYLKLIEKKASGELKTTASWMRSFVTSSPKYKSDSVVSEELAYDLMWRMSLIASGKCKAPDLNDAF